MIPTEHEGAIAALYIDPRGPYPRMARVECWDASRDARRYSGPHPVVAHPPCRHWGQMRHLAHSTCATGCGWHGPAHDTWDLPDEPPSCPVCGDETVSDADCAIRAVEQVRRFGGVLEHPAGSKLWEHCGLPTRCAGDWHEDAHGGYTIAVDQVEWGHVARKRTWLYLVGVPREALEEPPFPGREPTHWVSGGGTGRGKPPPGIKICSAQQRRRTPPLFAEYLVRLAMSVRLGQAYRERFAR